MTALLSISPLRSISFNAGIEVKNEHHTADDRLLVDERFKTFRGVFVANNVPSC